MESGHEIDVVLAREEEAIGLVEVAGLICDPGVKVECCLLCGSEDLAKQSVGCGLDVDAPRAL